MMEKEDKEVIGLKHIIVSYMLYWRLFLGAFIIAVLLACLYLIFYPKTYTIKSRVLIQDESISTGNGGNVSLGDAAGLMKSFGLGGNVSGAINMDDEQAIFESHELLNEVVTRLGLNVCYLKPYSWEYKMYEDSPIEISLDSITNSTLDKSITFHVIVSGDNIRLTGKTNSEKKTYTFTSLPATFSFSTYNFILNCGRGYQKGMDIDMKIKIYPSSWIAEDLSKDINMDTYSDNSNIIEFEYDDYERKRGIDILNMLARVYNLRADTIKNKDSYALIHFLDGRINTVIDELIKIEQTIEKYKMQNEMTDIEFDLQFYADQMKELQSRIIELESQSYSIDLILDFIENPQNKYNLIPLIISSSESEKGNNPITTYNETLIERQKLIQSSTNDNPILLTLNKQIEKMRESVHLSISNMKENLKLNLQDLQNKENMLRKKMGNVPTQEREYLEYKRQQEILQGVYLVLLQKREEAFLNIGQNRDKALIVDNAYSQSLPIAPRKLYAAIFVFILTIALPVIFLFCKELIISLKEEFFKAQKSINRKAK